MTKIPDNINSLSATEIGRRLIKKALCPIELMNYYLERIKKFDSLSPYIEVFTKEALKNAQKSKDRIKDRKPLSRLDGVPIAWKDLFDISGYKTIGGSKLLEDSSIVAKDAITVARTKNKGLIPIGKTRTVEFALGGLGTNKHFGTPENVIMNKESRVPGGSSSGSATALARNMCAASIGTDTGGSVRIPAAWNKLYGLKTSYGKVPTRGVLPLSKSLDTIGPLAKSIEDLYFLYSILSNEKESNNTNSLNSTIIVARGMPFTKMDWKIESSFEKVLSKISRSGIKIHEVVVPEIENIYKIISELGSLVTYEAWNQWKHLIKNNESKMDINVLDRMQIGRNISSNNIKKIKLEQKQLSMKLYKRLRNYDAMLMPTVPILPPKISDVENNQELYNKNNILALRNTSIGNVLPMCAVTIPNKYCDLPVGIMLYKAVGEDYSLLKIADYYNNIINS